MRAGARMGTWLRCPKPGVRSAVSKSGFDRALHDWAVHCSSGAALRISLRFAAGSGRQWGGFNPDLRLVPSRHLRRPIDAAVESIVPCLPTLKSSLAHSSDSYRTLGPATQESVGRRTAALLVVHSVRQAHSDFCEAGEEARPSPVKRRTGNNRGR